MSPRPAELSVVVPTYNRAQSAVAAVTSVLEQTLQPDEVIVVDNGTGTATEGSVRALDPGEVALRYVREPTPGVSSARNRGAATARGRIVAFLDDDSVASPDWLQVLVDAHGSTESAVAVGGPIKLRWPCPRPAWVGGLEGYYGLFDLGSERTVIDYPRYPYASNMMIERQPLLSVGGFPTELGRRGVSLISNEEDGLFRRIAKQGWTVLYEPRATVYHWVHVNRLSRRWLLRRAFVQGRSDVLVDVMFEPARTRSERARRSLDSLCAAAEPVWLALRGRHGSVMGPLVRASSLLGCSVQDLETALRKPARGILSR